MIFTEKEENQVKYDINIYTVDVENELSLLLSWRDQLFNLICEVQGNMYTNMCVRVCVWSTC